MRSSGAILVRPSTSLRYAQDERERVSLCGRVCMNLLWFDLVSVRAEPFDCAQDRLHPQGEVEA